jgi:hypothetical protein
MISLQYRLDAFYCGLVALILNNLYKLQFVLKLNLILKR